MRLLVVSQYYWPEPFRITEICECLVRRGHIVDVLTSMPNIPDGEFYEGYGWFKPYERAHNGVGIERVNVVRRGRDSAIRLCLNCASFALNSLFHTHRYKKGDYDAVFVFNNSPVSKILPAKVLAKKLGVPNVIWILDIWPESMYLLLGMKEGTADSLFKRISRAVSAWLYRSADMILESSQDFEGKLRAMGISAPIEYFPNFAERPAKTDFSLERSELGFSDDDFVVGFSGNIGKAQGLEKLIEAAKLLPEDARVKWLLAGDGSELVSLKNAAKDAGVDRDFVFTGWIDSAKLGAYLAVCDALLAPLKDREVLNMTVPAKLQTYMYAAKPVIAFMNGAGAKLVEEAGCGVTARAEDPEKLAEAVLRLKDSSTNQLEGMGKAGREYCENNFDRDVLLSRLEGYLKDAVKERKTRGDSF